MAYGHLDVDECATWLGVCVAEKYTGRGLGREVVQALVNRADLVSREVWLTVDESNYRAKSLYDSFGFSVVKILNGVYYMRRERR